jgi:hypothetical protein
MTNSLKTSYLQFGNSNRNPNGAAIDFTDCQSGTLCIHSGNYFVNTFFGSYDYAYMFRGLAMWNNVFNGDAIDSNTGLLQASYYFPDGSAAYSGISSSSQGNNVVTGLMSSNRNAPVVLRGPSDSDNNTVLGWSGSVYLRNATLDLQNNNDGVLTRMMSSRNYWSMHYTFLKVHTGGDWNNGANNSTWSATGNGELGLDIQHQFYNGSSNVALLEEKSKQVGSWSGNTANFTRSWCYASKSMGTALCQNYFSSGAIQLGGVASGQAGVAFASLANVLTDSGLSGTNAAGISIWCYDCANAATCAGSSTGHMAIYNGSAWTCQ